MHGSCMGGVNWGSVHHMENHKAVGFISNASMDPPWKITKVPRSSYDDSRKRCQSCWVWTPLTKLSGSDRKHMKMFRCSELTVDAIISH